MRQAFVGVLLFAGLVTGATPVAGAARDATATLRIVIVDAAGTPVTSLAFLRRELARLLRDAGVEPRFRAVKAGTETASGELPVVLLASTGLGADRGRRLAGTTGWAGAGPAIWIYCPNVVGGVGLRESQALGAAEHQRTVGLALARVAAHEVVHALAPDLVHRDRGLMRPRLAPADLLGGGEALEADVAAALGAGAREFGSRGAAWWTELRLKAATAAAGESDTAVR
ncbi:MAG: hypothetical protein AB7O37_13570 [Vicinamibacteria bacterium]